MTFTPLITIYPEGDFVNTWSRDHITKAIWIFSQHFGYHQKQSRTRVNIYPGPEASIHTGSIKTIRMKYDSGNFKETTDTGKIKELLTIIAEALSSIGRIEGWDLETIEKAYQLSMMDGGNAIWYSKLIANKTRDIKARIMIQLEKETRVKIIAQFFDKKAELLVTIHIIDTFPHHVDWTRTFSKPSWIDQERFGFNLLNGQLLLLANAKSGLPEIIMAEMDWTRAEVEGHLRMLTYQQFSNNKAIADWMSQ